MLHHIVLLKLKPATTSDQLDSFNKAGKDMVGRIPGLRDFTFGQGIASTAHRAQGYQVGFVATLDRVEDLTGYASHLAHQEINRIREEIAEETLAFDFEEWSGQETSKDMS